MRCCLFASSRLIASFWGDDECSLPGKPGLACGHAWSSGGDLRLEGIRRTVENETSLLPMGEGAEL